jgi:uncharacterized membrane protein
MIFVTFFISILGFMISFYAFVLEQRVKKDASYKPLCDINSWISCSKPILSKYGNIFYVSNALVGMVFYSIVAYLSIMSRANMLFFASLLAVIVSLILGYILYFKIKSLCLLCTALYLINIILLLMTIQLL